MMEDEFYASIKLITGEEIFSLVMPSSEDDRIFLILNNPVTIEPIVIKNMGIHGVKIDPWIKLADDDTFILNIDRVITITEVKDDYTIKMYKKFLHQKCNKSPTEGLTAEMGYLSTVSEARVIFEKLYRSKDS